MPSELFPFDLPNPPYKKPGWYRARWKATHEEIAKLGGRICGPGEIRAGGGGQAGHLQSSPAPSGALPDLAGAADLEQSTRGTSSAAGTSDSEPSGEPASWGARLLP